MREDYIGQGFVDELANIVLNSAALISQLTFAAPDNTPFVSF